MGGRKEVDRGDGERIWQGKIYGFGNGEEVGRKQKNKKKERKKERKKKENEIIWNEERQLHNFKKKKDVK